MAQTPLASSTPQNPPTVALVRSLMASRPELVEHGHQRDGRAARHPLRRDESRRGDDAPPDGSRRERASGHLPASRRHLCLRARQGARVRRHRRRDRGRRTPPPRRLELHQRDCNPRAGPDQRRHSEWRPRHSRAPAGIGPFARFKLAIATAARRFTWPRRQTTPSS